MKTYQRRRPVSPVKRPGRICSTVLQVAAPVERSNRLPHYRGFFLFRKNWIKSIRMNPASPVKRLDRECSDVLQDAVRVIRSNRRLLRLRPLFPQPILPLLRVFNDDPPSGSLPSLELLRCKQQSQRRTCLPLQSSCFESVIIASWK